MTTLYWDCFAGIAGNMAVASLLDLGADPVRLEAELAKLPFPEGRLAVSIRTIIKDGIRATYFNTHDDEAMAHTDPNHDHAALNAGGHDHTHCHEHSEPHAPGHDHTRCHEHHHPGSHAHAHEHGHGHGHGHDHEHDHDHDHEHDHDHDHHHRHDHAHSHAHSHDHSLPERGLREIRELIAAAKYPSGVADRALACFQELAAAEAEVHGGTAETVHFHEVGARDSIADIVGAAICLDELGVTSVHVSPVHIGRGFVHCRHGKMPVPAPATALLLRGYEMFSLPDVDGEMTTPTGAALLRGLLAKPGLPSGFVSRKIGVGAGSRRFAIPNVLRAFLGDSGAAAGSIDYDEITLLETNIDNASGELLGYAAERLWDLGALDVTMAPLTMKKGRPGTAFSVMVPPALAARAQEILFRELPTLGIRRQNLSRAVLRRGKAEIATPSGSIAAKSVIGPDGTVHTVPEYEALRSIAIETGTPLRDVQARLAKQTPEGA